MHGNPRLSKKSLFLFYTARRTNYSGHHQHAPCGLVDVNQPVSMVFTRWPRALGGTFRHFGTFKPFLQYFATGSDTALCQDYEEYEFVECVTEETQMIDLFTHCKLQSHIKLSRFTLATRLSSWSFWILFDNMKNNK